MSEAGAEGSGVVALDAVLRRLAGEMAALHAQSLEVEGWCLVQATGADPPRVAGSKATPSL